MMQPVLTSSRDPSPRAVQWDAAFSELERRAPKGQGVHLLLACLAMFGAGMPTTLAESLVWPVTICALLRLPRTRIVAASCFSQPFFWAVAAYAAWNAVSLAWSPDPVEGFDQLGAARFALVTISIWPVVNRRIVLIVCLLAGYALGNVSQLVEIVTAWEPNIAPGRDSGWWGPAVSGSILLVPLGLYLSIARTGHVWIGATGSAVTLLGLAATGTRGAWIAAAVVLAVAVVLIGLRTFRGGRTRLVVLLGALAVTAAGLLAFGGTIGGRIDNAREEIGAALQEGDYDSSTGRRLQMMQVAASASLEHPVGGVGAGGFKDYWRRWLERNGMTNATLAHAHNQFLHTAATAGAIGAWLLIPILVAFTASVRTTNPGPGIGFVALGLVLVSAFDCVLINQQTMMAICLLAGVFPAWSPHQIGTDLVSRRR